MEKENTQVDEGLEAVILKLEQQVAYTRSVEFNMNKAYASISFISGNDALKLIEFYNKHSKQD